MKKWVIVFIIILVVTILFPKSMGYSGGFTGGEITRQHCIGFKITTSSNGPIVPDGISSSLLCVGIPYK